MAIAFLDTDFIRKTKEITYNSVSLLDKTLMLSHDFYITEKVLNELPHKDYKDIMGLITQQKIILYKIKDMVNLLFVTFSDAAYNIILSDLAKITENLFGDSDFYNLHFKKLEAYVLLGTDVKQFADALENAIISVPKQNGIGEICTILNTIAFSRCKMEKIYSFMSDDKNARACAINSSDQITTYNCHSLFILLKNNGCSRQELKQFAKNWNLRHGESTVKIVVNGSSRGLNLCDYIDKIYSNEFKIKRNGLPELT